MITTSNTPFPSFAARDQHHRNGRDDEGKRNEHGSDERTRHPDSSDGTPTPEQRKEAVRYLELLRVALTVAPDLLARVAEKRKAWPTLRVVHQKVHAMSDAIIATPTTDGRWNYWWTWGVLIGPVNDPDAAAKHVGHVLTPQGNSQ